MTESPVIITTTRSRLGAVLENYVPGALAVLAGAWALRGVWSLAVRHDLQAFPQSFWWGLLLLASFWGWGVAVNRVVDADDRADLGLQLAWGMAFSIVVGGAMLLCRIAGPTPIRLFVATGLVVPVVDAVANRRAFFPWTKRAAAEVRREPLFYAAVAALVVVALVLYAGGAVLADSFNMNDDGIIYVPLAKRILQTGTLIEPFSMRRMASYGGQSYLLAMHLASGASPTYLNTVDRGIAVLIVVALVLGHMREHPDSSRLVVLLTLAFLLGLPNTHVNTTSMMTGTVCFLGLARTLSRRTVEQTFARKHAVGIGLLAAAACTLRQNYILPVAAMLTVTYAIALFPGGEWRKWRERKAEMEEAVVALGVLVVGLLPWMIVAYQSGRTFLFPVIRGNFNADYQTFTNNVSAADGAQFFLRNMLSDEPVRMAPLLVLAAVTMPNFSRRGTFRSLFIAAIIGFVGIVKGFTMSDPANIGRYYFGFTIATALALGLEASWVLSPNRLLSAAVPRDKLLQAALSAGLVVVAFALQLHDLRQSIETSYTSHLKRVGDTLDARTNWAPWPPADSCYSQLQASVPPGETIFALVDEPAKFDYKRNPIFNWDLPGAASPPPGLVISKGAEALASYLGTLKVRYVAYIPPDHSSYLYRRDTWEKNLKGDQAIWKLAAPFYLDAFDALADLRKTRKQVAEVFGLVMLDLDTHL